MRSPVSLLFPALVAVATHGAALPLTRALEWKQHVIFEGPGTVQTAVAADFTRDGRVDVIASSAGKVRLFVAPDWRQVIIYEFPQPRQQCIHSCVIDIDADGDPDYIGAAAHSEVFWLETPDDDEGAKELWKVHVVDDQLNGIHCLLAGDVNLDGKTDLIANSFNPDGALGSSITWQAAPDRPRETGAAWKRHVFARGDAPGGNHYMGLGDIDGDGQPDITCGAKGEPFLNGNWFAWWKNPGPAADPAAPWQKHLVAEKQTGATCLLPVDLNADHRTDLLASRGHGSGVLWYEQGEDGSWTAHDIDPGMEGPHCLAAADLDNDGDIDGATCGKDSMRTAWYENDGQGGFQVHPIGDDHAAYDIRAVDLDGDTDLDLLVAGQNTGNVVWYENSLKQGLILAPPATGLRKLPAPPSVPPEFKPDRQ